ncbi:MAG TPA: VCBS domain-containing protein [Allosphingosinicella sp.]|nr:VCBS domain-containing protein [Allosphingosinicella sp.]
MATQTTGGGSTTSFTNTPQAGDDCFAGYDEDLFEVIYLDVMQNDLGGKAKILWALDDGENDSNLMNGYEAADLLLRDLARMESTSTDTSENGAKIWITSDGKVGYDATTLSADFRADLNSLAVGEVGYDSFIYSIRLANGTLSWARAYIEFTGTNDAPTVSAADNGSVVEDANDPTLSDTGTITFDDVDLSDTHAVDSVTPSGTNTLGGTLVASVTDAATGAGNGTVTWTYEVANSATQYLGAGKTATESFTIRIKDNNGGYVDQLITVTIIGTNDDATISAAAGGDYDVVEAGGFANGTLGDPDAAGDLEIVDVDAGEAVFQMPLSLEGTYGTFTFVAATGAWTYTLDNDRAATQALNAGDPVTDTLTVTSSDGTDTFDIVVNITGSNDDATIEGSDNGAVTEDGALVASGVLTVSDVDGADTFVAQTITNAYGTFTLEEDGDWTFELDNDADVLDELDDGESQLLTFVVASADGTTHEIEVTVNGADEVPADLLAPTDIKFSLDETSANNQGSNLGSGNLLGTLTAIDADSTSWTFSLGGTHAGLFALAPASGTNGSVQLKVGSTNVGAGTYTITVTATDSGGNSFAETYKIWVGATGADGSLTAPVLISTGSDIDFGVNGDDVIFGGAGDDALVGGQNDDTLNGGLGNDELLGGGNKDNFRFEYDGATTNLALYGIDRILDMNASGDDTIQLDDALFAGVTAANLSSVLVFGTAALDANDRIIYNSTTGALYYDADGNGAGAAVQFAQLDANVVLTISDFAVI